MEPNITTKTRITPTSSVPRPPWDARAFWRVLLAVIAPLPMLAKGTQYLLNPVDGDAGFRETVAAYAAHRQLLDVLTWLDAVFVVGLIPATVAVAWVARRGAPRLTTVGAAIALPGFFAGIALLGGVETPALVAVRHGVDVNAMAKLSDALDNEPLLLVASLLFIVGVVIGLSVLGIAMWRSRAASAWMGIALAVGGFTHPFIPGHVAQGIGLLVAAAGFAGASIALLRMRNDEFDLAPVRPAGAAPDA
jgi:hypothetical protein